MFITLHDSRQFGLTNYNLEPVLQMFFFLNPYESERKLLLNKYYGKKHMRIFVQNAVYFLLDLYISLLLEANQKHYTNFCNCNHQIYL